MLDLQESFVGNPQGQIELIFPPAICEGSTLTITRNTVGRITTIGTSIRVLNPAPADTVMGSHSHEVFHYHISSLCCSRFMRLHQSIHRRVMYAEMLGNLCYCMLPGQVASAIASSRSCCLA